MSVSRETGLKSRSAHAIKGAATRKRANDARVARLQAAAFSASDALLAAELLHTGLVHRAPGDINQVVRMVRRARSELLNLLPIRSCRICGCRDERACVTNGVPCHWVGPDLCSSCAAEGKAG